MQFVDQIELSLTALAYATCKCIRPVQKKNIKYLNHSVLWYHRLHFFQKKCRIVQETKSSDLNLGSLERFDTIRSIFSRCIHNDSHNDSLLKKRICTIQAIDAAKSGGKNFQRSKTIWACFWTRLMCMWIIHKDALFFYYVILYEYSQMQKKTNGIGVLVVNSV